LNDICVDLLYEKTPADEVIDLSIKFQILIEEAVLALIKGISGK